MTEIVQNNNSMKFDLIETGNSSSSGPDSDNLFNNLLGNVDIENTDREQDNQMSVDEGLHADKKIHEILSVLSEGNLKLDEDTIKEIKIQNRSFKAAKAKIKCTHLSLRKLKTKRVALFCIFINKWPTGVGQT